MEGNRFRENNNILNPMGAKETKFNCPNAFISSDRRNFQSFGQTVQTENTPKVKPHQSHHNVSNI